MSGNYQFPIFFNKCTNKTIFIFKIDYYVFLITVNSISNLHLCLKKFKILSLQFSRTFLFLKSVLVKFGLLGSYSLKRNTGDSFLSLFNIN